MPADERYDVAHERNKADSTYRYGCMNRVMAKEYKTIVRAVTSRGKLGLKVETIPHRMTTACRYDGRKKDAACDGCKWREDGC